MFKYALVLCLVTLFFQENLSAKFSPESIAAFALAISLGIFGWIAFERSRELPVGRKQLFSTIGMALCAGYIVDSFAWWKDFHPELRAVIVTFAACFSKPIFFYFYYRKNTYLNKIFGNEKPDNENGEQNNT